MSIEATLGKARDAMTVRRVYGEPVERNGVTVIPAAAIMGGGGGGDGVDETGSRGTGGGFGVTARPIGAYVIRDGRVSWRPAVDVNRLIMIVGVVSLAGILAGTRITRTAIKD